MSIYRVIGVASAAGLLAAVGCLAQVKQPPALETPVGGENSPAPSPPRKLLLETAELKAEGFSVRVPTGTWADAKGAPNYSVPGPIVSFKGPDGVWRGHGYLETYPRLVKFEGKLDSPAAGQPAGSATLVYTFEQGKSYKATVTARGGLVELAEESDLGPRNLYVFDCYYGAPAEDAKNYWLPTAGFALDLSGRNHQSLYLPCYYDKPEVTVNPAAAARAKADAPGAPGADGAQPEAAPKTPAGGVGVLAADPAKKDIAGFWCRKVADWKNGESMGIQLWQRRQLPADPGSRHFLGPETKSDSTPNPRTAGLLGKSLYEGHITIEFSLGQGTRVLGFAVAAKGDQKESLLDGFKKVVQAHR